MSLFTLGLCLSRSACLSIHSKPYSSYIGPWCKPRVHPLSLSIRLSLPSYLIGWILLNRRCKQQVGGASERFHIGYFCSQWHHTESRAVWNLTFRGVWSHGCCCEYRYDELDISQRIKFPRVHKGLWARGKQEQSMSQYCTLRPFHNQKMLTACVCLSIYHNVAAGFLEICFCLDLMCENVNAKGNL